LSGEEIRDKEKKEKVVECRRESEKERRDSKEERREE
jgi:hypothetical protein